MSKKTIEEQQGRILPYEDFNLLKFKRTKAGVDVTHHLGGQNPQEQIAKVEVGPHPDLQEKMNQLQLYASTRIGLLEGWDFSREHLKKNPNCLQKAIQGHKDALSRFKVNGITFVGEGETYGVCITGSVAPQKGGSFGLSVPKITFSKTELGYEEDVEQICEEIKVEVYNYLILRKKEQTNIEDQAEGFDNEGEFNHQFSIDDGLIEPEETEQKDKDGFDENGERDFVPSEEQLQDSKSEEE